jgi:hypothetical protein
MRFVGFPYPLTLALLIASGAALAGLHLLRSRPRPVRVVTTLFWSPARSAARPTHLWQRFRYLATFVLLLATLASFVLALSRAAWSWSQRPRLDTVLVLDGGFGMQAEAGPGRQRFDAAVDEARRAAAGLRPADQLAVIVADPAPRIIHGFDAPVGGLAAELAACRPASRPADLESSLVLARSLLRGREPGRIIRVSGREPTSMPSDLQAPGDPVRLQNLYVGSAIANRAILSALFVPDSVDPARGRLRVRIGSWGIADGRTGLEMQNGTGSGDTVLATVQTGRDGMAEWTSPPLPAGGQQVRVRLAGSDGLPVDNEITVRVPRRPAIVVAADPRLPPAIRAAMEATGCRLVPPGDPAAGIVAGPSGIDPSGPAILVAGDGPVVAGPAEVVNPGTWPAGRRMDFTGARCGEGSALNLANDPRVTLMLKSGDLVLAAMDARKPGSPRLLLGSALFGAGATIANEPGFARLIARSVYELAGWQSEILQLSATRTVVDAPWAAEQARMAAVSIVPGGPDLGDRGAVVPADDIIEAAGWWQRRSWSEWLLAAGLLFVLLEAMLHLRGRIV